MCEGPNETAKCAFLPARLKAARQCDTIKAKQESEEKRHADLQYYGREHRRHRHGKTLRLVEENCEAWRGKYICVANVHTTVTAHDDPTYLRVQNGAVMALPDGGRCPDTAARRALPTLPA